MRFILTRFVCCQIRQPRSRTRAELKERFSVCTMLSGISTVSASINKDSHWQADIMHTWSLGILDYVIFSVVNETIMKSLKLRKTSRRQGEEFHSPLFTDAFIRKLFTDEVPRLVTNID